MQEDKYSVASGRSLAQNGSKVASASRFQRPQKYWLYLQVHVPHQLK